MSNFGISLPRGFSLDISILDKPLDVSNNKCLFGTLLFPLSISFSYKLNDCLSEIYESTDILF